MSSEERISIRIVGSNGEYQYRFPDGTPIDAGYPLDAGHVAKVDFIEYLQFWGEIDNRIPDSIDICDVAYWTDGGKYECPEVDFRAGALAARLANDRLTTADVMTSIKVGGCDIVGADEQGRLVMECNNRADSAIWTIYGCNDSYEASALFDFRNKDDAVTMAGSLAALLDIDSDGVQALRNPIDLIVRHLSEVGSPILNQVERFQQLRNDLVAAMVEIANRQCELDRFEASILATIRRSWVESEIEAADVLATRHSCLNQHRPR